MANSGVAKMAKSRVEEDLHSGGSKNLLDQNALDQQMALNETVAELHEEVHTMKAACSCHIIPFVESHASALDVSTSCQSNMQARSLQCSILYSVPWSHQGRYKGHQMLR